MKNKLAAIMARLENSRLAPLIQFAKFGLVGAFNTLLTYVLEMLGYYVIFRDTGFGWMVRLLGGAVSGEQVRVYVVTLLAFIVTVTSSFLLNSRFVFRASEKQTAGQLLRAYFKTVLCYALTGMVVSPLLKLWLGGLGVPYWAASLLSLIVTIPLNFVMNKFWAYRGRA